MTNITKHEFLENLCDRYNIDSDNPVYVEYLEDLYVTSSERNFH